MTEIEAAIEVACEVTGSLRVLSFPAAVLLEVTESRQPAALGLPQAPSKEHQLVLSYGKLSSAAVPGRGDYFSATATIHGVTRHAQPDAPGKKAAVEEACRSAVEAAGPALAYISRAAAVSVNGVKEVCASYDGPFEGITSYDDWSLNVIRMSEIHPDQARAHSRPAAS